MEKPRTSLNASGSTPATLPDRAAQGQRFLEAFGPQGAMWFAEGKSFDEARELHAKAQAAEISDLKSKLAKAEELNTSLRGEAAPLSNRPAEGGNKGEAGKRKGAGAAAIEAHIRIVQPE